MSEIGKFLALQAQSTLTLGLLEDMNTGSVIMGPW